MNVKKLLAGIALISGGAYLVNKARRTRRKPFLPVATVSGLLSSNLFKDYEGHTVKIPNLQYLVENDLFYTTQLYPTDFFIKYCNERGIETNKEQLLQFERLGLFLPFAKVQPPCHVQWFWSEQIHQLFSEGVIHQPESDSARTKTLEIGEEGTKFDNYYSIFQVYPLFELLRSIERSRIKPEKWLTLEKKDAARLIKSATRNAEFIFAQHKNRTRADLAAAICQVIANRYYPQTQTDRRTIRVPAADILKWSWEEYRRNWNPRAIMADIGIDEETLRNLCFGQIIAAQEVDPMQRWHHLIEFMSVEKKQQLRGAAQLAQSLYAMERMLNMFHKDLTGEGVYLFEQSPEDTEFFYGPGVTQNSLEFLEYLSNEFHLNPKPKMILIVEGDGEYKTFPQLSKRIFRVAFPQVGISIMQLKGIGGFKKLERLIDINHDKQTLVFIVLDNENNADQIKRRLITTVSECLPIRTITRDEYIFLWEHSIERDNFTDEEIAGALTRHCDNYYTFSAAEVKEAYNTKNPDGTPKAKQGNPLKDLLDEKTGGRYPLKKVQLLESLFELITSSTKEEYETKWAKRPIIKAMNFIITLAQFNSQPQSQEAWQQVQESGFFGHVHSLKAKEQETKNYLKILNRDV